MNLADQLHALHNRYATAARATATILAKASRGEATVYLYAPITDAEDGAGVSAKAVVAARVHRPHRG